MSDRLQPAPYQLVALSKVLTNGFQAILVADGVGVGKTIASAYILSYLANLSRKPGIVICPPSLVIKWIQELKSKFQILALPIRSAEDLHTAERESSRGFRKNVPVYVLANSVMARTRIRDYPSFSSVVFDEIHNYRNKETKSFLQASQIAELATYRIGLSATPINNSLDDLVSELKILLPNLTWDAIQATLEEVWRIDKNKLTVPLITRFTKDKLRIHFAKRRIETRSISYSSEYMENVQKIISNIHARRGSRSSIYEDMTYFRLAASSPYAFSRSVGLTVEEDGADRKLAILEEILSSEQISQWLVFCAFEDTVKFLSEAVGGRECFTMTGGTPMFDRPSIIDAFRRTPQSLLIMTEVGSEGLDLQFCNGVINYDLHWNPMRLEQRIGRVDRVGQTKSEVVIYNIVVAGSIDERVMSVIRKKLSLLEGSVFSPGTLFGENSRTVKHEGRLFNERILSHETQESKALLGALEYTNKLSTEDYAILEDINAKYCLPSNLTRASIETPNKIRWLARTERTKLWLERIKTTSQEFSGLAKYYS